MNAWLGQNSLPHQLDSGEDSSADSRFHSVNVDLVGPLPSSGSYLLTVVDRFSRWPEAILITGANTATMVRVFVDNWVSHNGILAVIISDRGPQFVSQLKSDVA